MNLGTEEWVKICRAKSGELFRRDSSSLGEFRIEFDHAHPPFEPLNGEHLPANWPLRSWSHNDDWNELHFTMEGSATSCLMELVPAHSEQGRGILPWDEALPLCRRILAILAEAEELGADVRSVQPWHLFLQGEELRVAWPLLPVPLTWSGAYLEEGYPPRTYDTLAQFFTLLLCGYGGSDCGRHHPAEMAVHLLPQQPEVAEFLLRLAGIKHPSPFASLREAHQALQEKPRAGLHYDFGRQAWQPVQSKSLSRFRLLSGWDLLPCFPVLQHHGGGSYHFSSGEFKARYPSVLLTELLIAIVPPQAGAEQVDLVFQLAEISGLPLPDLRQGWDGVYFYKPYSKWWKKGAGAAELEGLPYVEYKFTPGRPWNLQLAVRPWEALRQARRLVREDDYEAALGWCLNAVYQDSRALPELAAVRRLLALQRAVATTQGLAAELFEEMRLESKELFEHGSCARHPRLQELLQAIQLAPRELGFAMSANPGFLAWSSHPFYLSIEHFCYTQRHQSDAQAGLSFALIQLRELALKCDWPQVWSLSQSLGENAEANWLGGMARLLLSDPVYELPPSLYLPGLICQKRLLALFQSNLSVLQDQIVQTDEPCPQELKELARRLAALPAD